MSFGALGDSYYEYLLKLWVLKGRQGEMFRQMWEQVRSAVLTDVWAGANPVAVQQVQHKDEGPLSVAAAALPRAALRVSGLARHYNRPPRGLRLPPCRHHATATPPRPPACPLCCPRRPWTR